MTTKPGRLAAFAAALLLLPSLSALAQDKGVSLTWLANAGQSPRATTPAVKQYYQGKVEAWERAHPGVELKIEYHSTDINASMTRLQQQVQVGAAPDLASIDSFFLARFYDRLQSLDDLVAQDDVADFVGFARQGMHDPAGHLKALWVNTDVRALHYRKDLVPTPPATWDELIAAATKASEAGATGYLFPGGRGEASVMEHLPMFWAQGGRLVDDGGDPVFGEGANRDALLKVLRFIKRAVDEGASPARVVNYRFESDMYPDLLRGNVAMFLGGSWMVKQLRDLGDKAQWSVAPIPMPPGAGRSTAAGGWTYGVFTPDPTKRSLAVDLVRTLAAGPEGMADATAAQGNLPTRESVMDSKNAYLAAPATAAYVAMLADARARPGAAIYPVISTELQVAISNVITGQSTPEAALDQAWAKVKAEAAR